MHTNRNLERELQDIDDNLADATMLGDERELSRLQNRRIALLREWQENAGI